LKYLSDLFAYSTEFDLPIPFELKKMRGKKKQQKTTATHTQRTDTKKSDVK
jgi:hypothetical protein